MKDRKVISVFGSSSADPTGKLYGDARTWDGCSRGRIRRDERRVSRTMEAVSRGAKEGEERSSGSPSPVRCVPPLRQPGLDEEIKKSDYMSRLEHLTVDTTGVLP